MLFSNCCSLEILKLECPKLTSLFLQVCILHFMFEALNHFLGMSLEDMKLISTIFFFFMELNNVGLSLWRLLDWVTGFFCPN